MRFGAKRVLAGLVLAAAACGAQASVQIGGIALDPVAARLGRTVYVPVGYAEVSAGASASATVNWQSYSATLSDMLSAPNALFAPSTTLAVDAVKRGQLSTLATQVAALPTDANSAAAMQLAIWEIVFEAPVANASLYNVSLGNFSVTGGNSVAAAAQANIYLSNLASGLWRTSSNTDLDIVLLPTQRGSTASLFAGTAATPPAVPEPASWAMLTLGFGALGVALRRRRRVAREAAAIG